MEGWIKLHRKVWQTSFAKEPLTMALFFYLLAHVNHKPNELLLNGKLIKIEAGQLVTGRRSLARQTGLTERNVRTALVNLKTTHTIAITSTTKYSVITVLNWNYYQEATHTTTNKRPSSDPVATTNNNVKNEDNEIKRERTLSYLLTLNDEEVKELTSTYKVKQSQLKEKAESLHNYCKSHGKVYKNYKALLQNALMKDFGKKPVGFKSTMDELRKGGIVI